MNKELFDKGLKVRREVLGSEYVDNAIKNADDFSRPLQEFVTEYCWGELWNRPGLDRKSRSMAPSKGPPATRDCPCSIDSGRSASSQDSPIGPLPGDAPSAAPSREPPQARTFRSGAKRNGGSMARAQIAMPVIFVSNTSFPRTMP